MLNLDFKQRVMIDTDNMDWVASPAGGVWRKPLAREEAERGHATSVVRYESGARFSAHYHPLGEEILVLEGVFSDETGDYPAGTYLRNPEGFRHAPFSEEGCVLLVKLHQFQPGDDSTVRIDTLTAPWQRVAGGLQVMPLHSYRDEHVSLVKWLPGESFHSHSHFRGEEIFVLSGNFCDEFGCYPKYSWLRSPHLSEHRPHVDEETVIWAKTGHLPQ